MSFARVEFLLFLAGVVGLFQFAPAVLRRHFLLATSAVFYWYGAEREWNVLVLAGSVLLSYAAGNGIGAASGRARTAWFALGLAGNLALLAFFKYQRMLAETWNALAGGLGGGEVAILDLGLPLGISFYTFQALSYLIDVWRGRAEPCRSLLDFALYKTFFPQLVAGPIERAGHLLPQLRATSALTLANLSVGSRLILWGLLKKLVVAERLSAWALPQLDDPRAHDPLRLLVAGAAMTAVLYQDFSAYTDIARGSARLFGVDLVPNFRLPFLSTSVPEFWRRWHMSLTSWIADYVISPLSSPHLSHARIWRNNLLALGLFGLWHGASWKFLGWGLLVGAQTAAVHSLLLARRRRGQRPPAGRAYRVAAWFLTMAVGAVDMGIFFAPDSRRAWGYVAGLLPRELPSLGWFASDLLGAIGVLLACFGVHALAALFDLERAWARLGTAGRLLCFAAAVVALLLWREPDPQAFVYVRF